MHYLHIQLLSKNLHAIKKELPYLWEKGKMLKTGR